MFDLDLPVRGLEPLRPFIGCVLLYLLFWMAFVLVFRRGVLPYRRDTIAPMQRRATGLLLPLILLILMLGSLFWALGAVGALATPLAVLTGVAGWFNGLPTAGLIALLLLLLALLFLLITLTWRSRAPGR